MSRRKDGWTGATVAKARRYVAFKMAQAEASGQPLLCSFASRDPLCPGVVLLVHDWHVDHVHGRADGGKVHDPNNWWPAHAACNTRASAQRTNAMRTTKAKRVWAWATLALVLVLTGCGPQEPEVSSVEVLTQRCLLDAPSLGEAECTRIAEQVHREMTNSRRD